MSQLSGRVLEDAAWSWSLWQRLPDVIWSSALPASCADVSSVCRRCGVRRRPPATYDVQVALLPSGPRQLCDDCWLLAADAVDLHAESEGADGRGGEKLAPPLAALLQVKGGEDFLRQLLSLRQAPFAPRVLSEGDSDEAFSCPEVATESQTTGCANVVAGEDVPRDNTEDLVVVWDATDLGSAARARALRCEYRGLCGFAERSGGRLEALLAKHPGLRAVRAHICREKGLSAILSSGVFIGGCEDHPKVLLYELLYRKTLRLPSPASLARLEELYFAPLRQLRSRCLQQRDRVGPGADGRWWLQPAALELMAKSLERRKFAVVDGFMPDGQEDVWAGGGAVNLRNLQDVAKRLYASAEMHAGLEEQQGSYGGFWGAGNEGDFLNREGLPRKWAMEGDFRCWLPDEEALQDPAVACVGRLALRIDALVSALRDAAGDGASEQARRVADRLRQVAFREPTMVACYPGASRGKYLRHCDTGRGAALTAIFYLNSEWCAGDGGELRLYEEGFHNTQVKIDLEPVANRLLLFWATEECPHEVLPALRDRYAMTIWFRDGRALDAAALADTSLRCTPMAPLSREAALRRATRG
eukprot:TRINITY_DN30229_c0_g1_i1.p1 TRINITY_DN30229_c0_g1~~TRINITY_DN30229_c0_g1_i1.p1  ORF type:complete len:588 (-),score=132.62 TRINITY_DN30229_c0_g1_i1:96-1859(-)